MYGADVHYLAFVFPSRRSGIFFRKYLSEAAARPVFSPAILTISDLFRKLNPKQQVDRIKLLFILYDIYIRQSGSDETFDDFVYWGEMLLNDFDDIDKYLVDARQLFTNVTDLNYIDKRFSYLTPSQIQAIRSFWSSFKQENDVRDATESSDMTEEGGGDSNRRFFLRVWELLYPVYAELRERLTAEGIAYEGMIYREAVENLENMPCLPYRKIVFIGFNALTKAEKMLLKHLKEQGIADFYWDYASEKIRDKDNRASFFMAENRSLFPSEYALPEEEPEQTQFEIIGIPSRIGQAKHVYSLLEKLSGGKTMPAEGALQIAIVLPDEQLLIPVLNSIPETVSRINVTLGYALSATLVASLINNLQSLQKNIRRTDDDILFYHRDVIAVLRHRYISSVLPAETSGFIREITERNQVYIPISSFEKIHLLKLLFSVPVTAIETSGYLTDILKELNASVSSAAPMDTPRIDPESSDNEEMTVNVNALEQEFLFHYYSLVNRMREMIREAGTDMSTDTYFRLLKQMTDFVKIPFHGEPLSGLQIMGALETRALDFENLIILSVNEGIFPAKSVANSFIPYHLRKGFGLPSPEHQEAIWAYHFYRMIYRAKKVTMLYDTRTDGLQSGEVSRFVHQLIFHYRTSVERKVSVYDVSSSYVGPLCVDKDNETMRLLAAYETEKSLSASAINIYLDCPLKFYFSVLKGMNEETVVNETLGSDLFGTILHRVMELIYKPLCGKTVTADLLRLAAEEKNMTEIIQQAFTKDFFHTDTPRPLTGQTCLYGETIRKYACKALEYDRSLPPFVYIGSEKLFHSSLELNDGRKVRIKGFIDRIDSTDDVVRIADYKSGRPSSLTFGVMDSLFDMTAKERKKAIMQVFLYAWIYTKETGEKNVMPTVYYMRNLFGQGGLDPFIRQVNGKEKTIIENFRDYRETFENNLRTCLNELFDAEQPFIQTSNAKICEYCPFSGICGRQ
jgi:hypothetical protein